VRCGPARAHDIRLGAQATEREIKKLSASGELANYRIVHFATHGVLAGQLDGTYEPGLVLTPPDKATEADEGYFSASEIAMQTGSRCRPATRRRAQQRARCAVRSGAGLHRRSGESVAVLALGTRARRRIDYEAIREMARDTKVGRAEALRRSMLALIDKGEPQQAHPAYWAPFVVVGEGAPVR
jgi:CHAT domain-containing protein